MLNQFKYTLRNKFYITFPVLVILIGLNLILALLGLNDIYGFGGKVTAVVLSSLIFLAWLVVCILSYSQTVECIFSSPLGYNTALAPVASWKILMPRVLVTLVVDLIGFAIAIFGIILQSFVLANIDLGLISHYFQMNAKILWLGVIIAISYLMLIVGIFFITAIRKSYFKSLKAGGILSVILALGVLYALSWLSLPVLVPFGNLSVFGPFLSVELSLGFNSGTIAYIILSLAKSSFLFIATSFMMERKINL